MSKLESRKLLVMMPARGGSKRIKRKNIRPFCGKPMMARPLSVLANSSFIDEIIISTDDAEIAEMAGEMGAVAPFVRPDALADDFATTFDVIEHALSWHEAERGPVDYVLTVYPTAVFLEQGDVEAALEMMLQSGCDHVFAGTEFAFPIQRAVKLDEQGRVSMFAPEHQTTRSQDLEPAYHDAGQFYLSRSEAIKNRVPFFSPSSKMVILPRHRVVDIDTMEDFELAEKLFTAWGNQHQQDM